MIKKLVKGVFRPRTAKTVMAVAAFGVPFYVMATENPLEPEDQTTGSIAKDTILVTLASAGWVGAAYYGTGVLLRRNTSPAVRVFNGAIGIPALSSLTALYIAFRRQK